MICQLLEHFFVKVIIRRISHEKKSWYSISMTNWFDKIQTEKPKKKTQMEKNKVLCNYILSCGYRDIENDDKLVNKM